LNTWLAQADLLQKGYLNYGRFEGVIKKLEIDPKIISDEDIKSLYQRFSKLEDAFDIKDFVSHLREFQMDPEDIYVWPL
jgi:lipoate-protein ligase A